MRTMRCKGGREETVRRACGRGEKSGRHSTRLGTRKPAGQRKVKKKRGGQASSAGMEQSRQPEGEWGREQVASSPTGERKRGGETAECQVGEGVGFTGGKAHKRGTESSYGGWGGTGSAVQLVKKVFCTYDSPWKAEITAYGKAREYQKGEPAQKEGAGWENVAAYKAMYMVGDADQVETPIILNHFSVAERGHILSNAMGGDGKDPKNIFAQDGGENNGGTWKRFEKRMQKEVEAAEGDTEVSFQGVLYGDQRTGKPLSIGKLETGDEKFGRSKSPKRSLRGTEGHYYTNVKTKIRPGRRLPSLDYKEVAWWTPKGEYRGEKGKGVAVRAKSAMGMVSWYDVEGLVIPSSSHAAAQPIPADKIPAPFLGGSGATAKRSGRVGDDSMVDESKGRPAKRQRVKSEGLEEVEVPSGQEGYNALIRCGNMVKGVLNKGMEGKGYGNLSVTILPTNDGIKVSAPWMKAMGGGMPGVRDEKGGNGHGGMGSSVTAGTWHVAGQLGEEMVRGEMYGGVGWGGPMMPVQSNEFGETASTSGPLEWTGGEKEGVRNMECDEAKSNWANMVLNLDN